ncbi:hypothetical protein N8U67_24405, partial [Enterobacter hormaechei subsp. steigerwaltii]|nr:hypothetical protein [Enterobacter hormaechei subsp. steigerwaltii]MCU3268507.1 hypothetical protein [Enterobacter hormaechei subsp. steigerwaltii]MCU3283703.1 hypothetical protein [Enterobacter hormaechei subsp. steigerwaltii]
MSKEYDSHLKRVKRCNCPFGVQKKKPSRRSNAVHLSGAALRFTGKRVFDIFTALGLDGLGRFSMNMTPMQPR